MKHHLIGSSIVLAFALPAAASEFDFQGAEFIGTGYFNRAPNVGLNWTTASLGASAQVGLGSNLFLQKDVTLQGYDMPWGNFYLGSLGGHVGYDIGSDTSIGAFGVAELWDDKTGEAGVGAEIAGRMDNFFYEGYGAYLFDPLTGTGWRQYHVEATGGYDFGNGVDLGVGFHYGAGDLRFTDRMWQGLVDVGYDLGSDMRVEAGYIYSDSGNDFWDSHGVKLSFTKVIGGGTTFGQRNYLSIHNGY